MGAKTIGSWLGHAGVMDVIPHAGRSWSNFETIVGGRRCTGQIMDVIIWGYG